MPVHGMGPRSVSEALSLIADVIELDDHPSRSVVASDLRDVLQLVESPDTFGNRVAIFDTLKKLKRKVFDSKGVRKLLEKIDRIKTLQKACRPLVKAIRSGEDMADIAAEEEWVAILYHATDHMGGGSGKLEELSKAEKSYEVTAVLGEMDEYYEDEEDDEEKDRKILADAVSDFYDESEKRIKELEKKIERAKKDDGSGELKRDRKKKPEEKKPEEKKLLKRKKEEPEGEKGEEKPAERLKEKPKEPKESEEALASKFSSDFSASW